jgi:hypothetical protein
MADGHMIGVDVNGAREEARQEHVAKPVAVQLARAAAERGWTAARRDTRDNGEFVSFNLIRDDMGEPIDVDSLTDWIRA